MTVTQLPLVRCAVCGRTLAHQKGSAGDVLTRHYTERHPEILGLGAEDEDLSEVDED